MTLKQQLEQALAGLMFFSTPGQTIDVSDGTQQLTVELSALDTLACSFTSMTLRSDALTQRSSDELKKIAEQLAARLTYLLEPISPIETDAEGCTVQMRSTPPQRDPDRTTYYELLVARTGSLSLVRYSRAAGQPRQIIPAQVTREVLTRLASDLSAVAV